MDRSRGINNKNIDNNKTSINNKNINGKIKTKK